MTKLTCHNLENIRTETLPRAKIIVGKIANFLGLLLVQDSQSMILYRVGVVGWRIKDSVTKSRFEDSKIIAWIQLMIDVTSD